jgi:subtilase family serine protease
MEFDTGAVSPDMRLERMMLVLSPDRDQQAALDELLAAQQDPDSPEYQRWLTPEAFGSRFGVSESDTGQIVRWLEMHGFEVEPLSPARRSIVFSGTAFQVAAAFHTEIHTYNVNGASHFANASAPRIPEALAGVVEGVVSLHDFHTHPMHTRSEWTASNGSHYVTPGDFATIYDLGPLYANSTDGTGQSIAIIGRTNISLADVQSFRSKFGLPVKNPTIVLNGPDPGIVSTDEEGEALLDVEWAGAVAKMATVQLIVSASTSTSDGVTLSAQYAVNHNVAPTMSLSFGNCEAAIGKTGNQFWNSLWQQAAAQGMTVLVSSGDSGAAGCDDPSATKSVYGRGVNGLCSSPYSTCVGGTRFNDTASPSKYWSTTNSSTYASALSYIPEFAWNESAAVSGGYGLWSTGGGASIIYAKPTWQSGPGVVADGVRDVPDVSLNASAADPVLICMNGSFYAVSGTSVAAPSLAGVMVLATQKAGARLGNVNPALYTLAAKQASGGAAVFHDVTAGTNSVPGATGYSAGAGYDLVTGLGSVDAAVLVNHWSDAAVPAPSFQVSASPASVAVKAGASATTSVTLSVSGGFNSAVALSVSGLASGLTAAFSPATIAAGSTSSTLTLTASAQAAGNSTMTITAAGGGLTRTVPVVISISAASCSYAIDPTSVSLASATGTYSVKVTATVGCSWTAVSNSSWITVTAGATGSGSGTVNYSLAANTATTARSGAIVIAGRTLAVTQGAAAPQFSLLPSTASFAAAGGSGSIAMATGSSTTWTAVSNASWITITSGASGVGSKTVTYAVAANTAASTRTGTITIGASTFSVTEAGVPCSYTLGVWSTTQTATGVLISFPVTAPSGCAWTATSSASWLTVVNGATGNGKGVATYNAATNTTGTSRTAIATIAGIQVTVKQGR